MTESALYAHRVFVEKRLLGIVSKVEAMEMLVTLQLVLAKFMLSEVKKLSECNKARDVYFGSPEYALCCALVIRLAGIAKSPSFMAWYQDEHNWEAEEPFTN